MKKIIIIITLIVGLVFTIKAQTPQERVQSIVDAVTANCDNEGSVWGADSATAVMNYSLYREFYKQKNYKDAYPYWLKIFNEVPKARQTTHQNGQTMHKHFAANAASDEIKMKHIDTVLAIYDIRAHCFENTAELKKRKATAWYKYYAKDKTMIPFVYDLYNKAHEAVGSDNMSTSFPKQWITMAIQAHKIAKTIEEEEVLEVYDVIEKAAYTNAEKGDAGEWKGAVTACYEMLEKYDYMNPERIRQRAQEAYDKGETENAYKLLRSIKATDDPLFIKIVEEMVQNDPNVGCDKINFLASRYAKDGRKQEAIDMMLKAADMPDCEDRADVYYQIAQVYRGMGSYSNARKYANKAADARPGWGNPYILIGEMYASSGAQCKAQDEFLGWAVSWAAVDMFQKAKSVDPTVSDKAQKLINKYAAYYPSAGDLFFKKLKAGDSFYVGCWIGKNTTVRVK